MIKSWPRQPF